MITIKMMIPMTARTDHTERVHEGRAVYTASQTPCVPVHGVVVPRVVPSQQSRAAKRLDHISNSCLKQLSSLNSIHINMQIHSLVL